MEKPNYKHCHTVGSSADSTGVQKSGMKGTQEGKGFFHAKHNCQNHSETPALAEHAVYPTGQDGDFGQEKMLRPPTILFPRKFCDAFSMELLPWGCLIFPTPAAERQPGEQLPAGPNKRQRLLRLCFSSPVPCTGDGKRARAPGERARGLSSARVPSAAAFHEY